MWLPLFPFSPVNALHMSFTYEETEAQRHQGTSPGSERVSGLSTTDSLSRLRGREPPAFRSCTSPGPKLSSFYTTVKAMGAATRQGEATYPHDFWGHRRAGAKPERERSVDGITRQKLAQRSRKGEEDIHIQVHVLTRNDTNAYLVFNDVPGIDLSLC